MESISVRLFCAVCLYSINVKTGKQNNPKFRGHNVNQLFGCFRKPTDIQNTNILNIIYYIILLMHCIMVLSTVLCRFKKKFNKISKISAFIKFCNDRYNMFFYASFCLSFVVFFCKYSSVRVTI